MDKHTAAHPVATLNQVAPNFFLIQYTAAVYGDAALGFANVVKLIGAVEVTEGADGASRTSLALSPPFDAALGPLPVKVGDTPQAVFLAVLDALQALLGASKGKAILLPASQA